MTIEHRVSIPGGTRIYTVGYQLHLETNGLLLPALDRWDGKAPIRDTIDAALADVENHRGDVILPVVYSRFHFE